MSKIKFVSIKEVKEKLKTKKASIEKDNFWEVFKKAAIKKK